MAFNSFGGGNPRYGRDPHEMQPPPPGQMPQQQNPNMYHFMNGQQRLYYQQPSPAVWTYGAQQFSGALHFSPYIQTGTRAPVPSQPPMLAQGQGPQLSLGRDFRTCSMRNTTGGFGCEPGYNYFFPAEHTKIHVLKSGTTPPWQLPANFAIQFHACHVPVNTTVAELLKGFGARNSVPKKNVITEVCPGGGGKWYKGIEVRGDSFDMLKKPIKELGWDASRTGLRGEKKVVYIFVQKD